MRGQSYSNKKNNSNKEDFQGGETKVMKKSLKMLLVFALVFSMFVPAIGFAAEEEEDLGVYTDAVTRLGALGVVTGHGDGTFAPEDSITRAEATALMVRLLGLEEAAQANMVPTQFKDGVAAWASGYVNVAVQQGIIKGYADGTFGEKDPVRHAEVLAMLVRALGYEPAVSEGNWPTNYIVQASQLGITDGVAVSAYAPAKRGEVALLSDNSLTTAKLVQTGFGDSKQYVVSGTNGTELKTILSDDLKVDKVKGVVTANARTNTKLDDNEVKIDTDTYEVLNNVDVEAAFGASVTAYVNADDVVVDFNIGTTYLDAVSVNAAADELTLVVADEDYDIDSKATVYLNGSAADLGDLAGNSYSYGKVALNSDDEVRFVEVFNFDSLVVEDIDGDVVYSYGEELDVDGFTLVLNGKTIALEDVEVGDILFYNEDAAFAEVYTDYVEGSIDEVFSTSFEVDGESFDYVTAVYLDGDTILALDEDVVLAMEEEGEDVTVFTDRLGDAVFVYGDLGNVATSSFYGYVTADSERFQDRSKFFWTLDVLTKDDEVVKYDVSEKFADKYDGVEDTNTLDWGTDIIEEAVVKVTVNVDNEVKNVELLTDKVLSGAFKTDAKYVGKYELSSSAAVFLAEDRADVSATTLADVDFSEIDTYEVYANSNDTVIALVVTASNRGTDTTDYAAVAKSDSAKLAGEDTWKLTLLVDGEEKVYYTEEDAATLNASAVSAGDLVEITVNDVTNEVEVVTIVTSGAAKYVTGDVYDVSVRNSTFNLDTSAVDFKLTSDAKVYDVTGSTVKAMNFRDLVDGDTLEVYTAVDNSRFVKYIVKTVDAPVAGGGSGSTANGDFEVKVIDLGNDLLTLENSNGVVKVYNITAGSGTTVELTNGTLETIADGTLTVTDEVNITLTEGTDNVTYIKIIVNN